MATGGDARRFGASRARRAPRDRGLLADRSLGPVLGFLRALWGVNHALESWSRRMKRRIGVTGPERMVQRLVGRQPGITSGELARLLRVHPSTLTGLLRRLVARGLLARRADASDGRRALVTLTPDGAEVDGTLRGTVEGAVRVALRRIPDGDARVATDVLEAVMRALGE
jgi:MarR family transcriptional regulator, organic hydroperoxide resistance regulator